MLWWNGLGSHAGRPHLCARKRLASTRGGVPLELKLPLPAAFIFAYGLPIQNAFRSSFLPAEALIKRTLLICPPKKADTSLDSWTRQRRGCCIVTGWTVARFL